MVSAPAYYFKILCLNDVCSQIFFFVIILQDVVFEKTDIFVIAYACLSGDLKDKISSSFESSLKKKFPYQQGKSVGI